MSDDGVALFSTAHPKGPWWKYLWLLLFHRGPRASSLELVTLETLARDAPARRILLEKRAAYIFNNAFNEKKDK